MKTTKNKHKKILLALILGGIALIIAVSGMRIYSDLQYSKWQDSQPKPLGEKLEYIGKLDYGCDFGYCDSHPGSTYYYGTDMNLDEIKVYFKKAHHNPDKTINGGSAKYNSLHLEFNVAQNDRFTVAFYDNKRAVMESFSSLTESPKKYIISIDSKSYETAKNSL